MEISKKAIFHGISDGVLDYLKLAYNYGYREEHLDGFYYSIDTYSENYGDDDDDYSIRIDFTYGFYDSAANTEDSAANTKENSNINFSSKGSLDIYYPNIFAAKTPEQVHDIVYGMTFAYMQNRDE